eukprot:TRINITY_DN1373_c0_g1_i4.p1 TRINITY_DN1373_c0_g1~~TRINITY_DN1373_c0_g1_i4.p1  ORF type:complete len:309 (-),score=38.99 TRINITY_DN1373_c0_g1_i4:123-1049(-)
MVDQDRDTVTRGPENCPSFYVELPRISAEYSASLRSVHGDFLDTIQNLTGFDHEDERTLVHAVEAMVETTVAHNAGHMLDPDGFLINNFQLLMELGYGYFYAIYQAQTGDPRGTVGGGAAREMISDISGLLDGTHRRRGSIHVGHRSTTASVYVGLDLEAVLASNSVMLLQEFRSIQGQVFVYAYTLRPVELGDGTFDFDMTPEVMPCGGERCTLQDWETALRARNPQPFEQSCCNFGFQTGFFDLGCHDYENPNVLNIEPCRRSRTHCPTQACGPVHYLDWETQLCVPLGLKVNDFYVMKGGKWYKK